MVELGFHAVARASLETARKEAAARREAGRQAAEAALGSDAATAGNVPAESDKIGKECVRFQAMRVAYFAADNVDSRMRLFGDDSERLVLNRIVSLKEDAGKAK